MMELVIKIPEVFYEALRNTDEMTACIGPRSGKTLESVIFDAVAKGTPLPEGHGPLKDVRELSDDIRDYIRDTSNLHYDDLTGAEDYNAGIEVCLDEIEDAPTIIGADEAATEE